MCCVCIYVFFSLGMFYYIANVKRVKRGRMIFWVEYPFLFLSYCVHNCQPKNERGRGTHHTQYKDHIVHTKHKLQYLVVFGSLGQVKSGVDFSWTLLTEGRQLEGNWLSQAVTCLQLQVGWFSRDLVEVSEEMCQTSTVIEGMIYPFPNLVYNRRRHNKYMEVTMKWCFSIKLKVNL